MKREILFRGKRVDNGEYIQGDLTRLITPRKTALFINGIEVIPETIGQFTGLTDKNGVNIFEGDILDAKSDIVVVRYEKIYASFGIWKKGWAFLHYFHEAVEPNDCIIVGNIHDNPELLA